MLPSRARVQAITRSPGSSQPRAVRNAFSPLGSPASSHGNAGCARIASSRCVMRRLAQARPEASLPCCPLRLHDARPLGVGDVVAVARMLALDPRDGVPPPIEELAAPVGDAGARHRTAPGLEGGIIATGQSLDMPRAR